MELHFIREALSLQSLSRKSLIETGNMVLDRLGMGPRTPSKTEQGETCEIGIV